MDKKERKKHEFSGKSTKLGITYYGDKFVVATYIDSKLLNPRHIVYEKQKKLWPNDDDLKWDSEKIKLLIGIIIMGIIIVICEFYFQKIFIKHIPMLYEIFYIILQLLVLGYLLYSIICFVNEETDEMKKFHAAEHMTASAFQDFGYVPDIDIIKKYSRYHPRCGIFRMTNVLFLLNVSYALHLIFGVYNIPLLLVLAVFEFGTFGFSPYSFLIQMLITTKKPEDYHLDVAKKCYEKLLSLETEDEVIYDNEEMSWIRLDRAEKAVYEDFNEEMSINLDKIQFWKNEIEDINKQAKIEEVMF